MLTNAWSTVMTRFMEHCDDNDVEHCDDKGMAHCDAMGHGVLC